MDTRFVLHSRRHARGAVKPVVLAIVAVFVALAAVAWFLIIKPHQEIMMEDSGGHPSTPVSVAARPAPPPPVNVAGMDINELISEARTAMGQQRYLAPAGNNAFEFYLRVLEKDPGNRVASDALRETFPFAATSAEQAINSRDFNEAQRQIDLLAKADPTNFTLTILRSKLDAQRKTLDKQQQLALDQQKAQQQADKAAADKLAADKLAEQQRVELVQKQKAAQTVSAQQATAQQSAKAATPGSGESGEASATPQGASTGGVTSPAVLIRAATPRYPPSALRSRQEGWVIVSFTIDPEGRPRDVKVIDSQPRRLFDRAAIEAVDRYRFTPAMRDGVAVSAAREQKLEFKL